MSLLNAIANPARANIPAAMELGRQNQSRQLQGEIMGDVSKNGIDSILSETMQGKLGRLAKLSPEKHKALYEQLEIPQGSKGRLDHMIGGLGMAGKLVQAGMTNEAAQLLDETATRVESGGGSAKIIRDEILPGLMSGDQETANGLMEFTNLVQSKNDQPKFSARTVIYQDGSMVQADNSGRRVVTDSNGDVVVGKDARAVIEAGRKSGIADAGDRATVIEDAKGSSQVNIATDKKFMEEIGREGAGIYSSLQKAAQQASAFIPRLQALKELASKVDTGIGSEIKLAAKKALGVDSADMEELNAKLGELAQDILNQQTGTKTDFDFQNAVRQSASLGKTPEANKRLISAIIERQNQAVLFGDQAKNAYEKGGVRAVLDMRYDGGPALPKGITEEDVQHTMMVHGVSRDEVLKRLGAQ